MPIAYVRSVSLTHVCMTNDYAETYRGKKMICFIFNVNVGDSQALVVHFKIIHLLKSDSAYTYVWKMLAPNRLIAHFHLRGVSTKNA